MARRVLGDDPFAKPAPTAAKSATKAAPARKVDARKKKPAKAATPVEAVARADEALTAVDTAPAEEVAPVVDTAPAEESAAPAEEAAAPAEEAAAPAEEAAAPASDATLRVDFAPPPDALEAEVAALAARIASLRASARDNPAVQATLAPLVAQLRTLEPPAPAPDHSPTAAADEGVVGLEDEGVDASAESVQQVAAETTARELLSSEFYLRQWGRVALRDRSERVDDFGYDPEVAARWESFLDFVYDRWLRVEVEGIEHVPAEGRVVLVANHGGAIPVDGVVLATALRKEHPNARHLRWLAEDFVFHFPYAGTWLNRLGAVRACPDNAERLLRQGFCVGLFPEGVKGISKGWRERYKLQRFGRGGHIKLALRTRTPIIPVSIVGSDEAHPMLGQSHVLAKMMGLPYMPITPTFPWLGPLGLMPLPTRWRIVFGQPLALDGYDPAQADDEVLVGRLNERLRSTIQETLDRTLRQRAGA